MQQSIGINLSLAITLFVEHPEISMIHDAKNLSLHFLFKVLVKMSGYCSPLSYYIVCHTMSLRSISFVQSRSQTYQTQSSLSALLAEKSMCLPGYSPLEFVVTITKIMDFGVEHQVAAA